MQICICRVSVEYKKLGDIATYINGYAFKPEQRGSEGLPIIRIQDLTGNAYDLGYYNGDYPKKVELNDGDVLISWSASLGVYLWNRGKALLNQHIFKVVFDKVEIDKFYFMYAVEYNLDKMSLKTHGATMKHITKKDFDNVVIPYPDLDYQKEVAYRLISLKGIIKKYQEQLDLLDELIKARFVEMFGDPIYNTQNRPMTEFINVVKMQRGYDLPVQDRNHEGSIPVYGANGVLGYHDVAKINNGGIITGRSGTIGKVYLANKEYWPLNTSLFSIDTYGNNLIYLQYLVTLYDLKRFVEGTGVPTLNRNMFHNKKIIEVSINEQNTFASFVEEVDKSRLLSNHSLFLIKSITF